MSKLRNLLTAILVVALSLVLGSVHAEVRLPQGQYAEFNTDLRVKVMGGFVEANRTWFDDKWFFNPDWAALKFTFDNLDGSVVSIARGDALYKLTSPGVFVQDKRNTIRSTATGYRWQDRQGNWIEFDTEGKILKRGDRNDVKISFKYDTNKKLVGVFDHFDTQVLTFEYTGNLLTAVRDYTSRRVQYQYTGSNLTKVIDVLGNAWAYTYDGANKLLTKTDPENRKTTITYNPTGRVATIKDADNIGPAYVYDYDKSKSEYYVKETSPAGKVTETRYNEAGQTIRQDINGKTVSTLLIDGRNYTAKDERGLSTGNEYDEWDNLVKVTYPDGSAVSYQYDSVFSNMIQKVNQNGVITKYEYDTRGNLTKLTEAVNKLAQRVTQYTYDVYGNKQTVKRVGDTATQEASTIYTYDNSGNVATITDPEGGQSQLDYDVIGNITRLKDARGKLWLATYDRAGLLANQSDPLGNTIGYVYDKVANRVRVTDSLNRVTQYLFDIRNNLVKITDSLGGITQFEYDGGNQRTKQIDADGRIQQATYTQDGSLAKNVDGNGNSIENVYGDTNTGLERLLVKINYPTFSQEFKYDSRSRLTQMIEVLDPVTRYTASLGYDSLGNRVTQTDKQGTITQFAYDELNRLIKITDAANKVTQFTYDARDNLILVRDTLGNVTQYVYDRNNRKKKDVRAQGAVTNYFYDEVGNQIQTTNPSGQVIKFSYDNAGRRIGESFFTNSNAANPDKSTNYSYDAANNLIGYSDGNTSAEYIYDALNRKVSEKVNYGGFAASYNYSYFANGQKKSLTYPDGVVVGFTFDANNQLSGIQLVNGLISYNSYQWGAPTKITLPGGTTKQFSYDPLMRVAHISVKDSSQSVVMNYQYGYDKVDNILSKNTEHGNYSYGYDELYRLTQAANPVPLANETYTYDGEGNRLTDSSLVGAWSYNADNQLTSYGNVSYQYDANGNTIRKTDGGQVTNFVYNSSNRLVQAKSDSGILISQYTYDPFGRRLSKMVNGITTYFMYSDEGLLAEFDASGTLQVAYGFAPDATWGTNPIFLRNGDGIYFYQNDHLGTPQKLTALDGMVVWSAKAQTFGGFSVEPNLTVINNLRLPGQYFDQETKTHYNFFRDYDPSTGRYMQSDPIGLSGGLNVYAYAKGRPTHDVDPLGLYSQGDINHAWDHYCDGTGTSWTANFSSINWGNTLATATARIKQIGDAQGCGENTIPLNFNFGAQTSGADKYIIGRHIVKISGDIKTHCDCMWEFQGNMSSALGFDPYDFDPSNRGLTGEALTWIGRNRCPKAGRPFNIFLPGQIPLSTGGAAKGTPTCCRV